MTSEFQHALFDPENIDQLADAFRLACRQEKTGSARRFLDQLASQRGQAWCERITGAGIRVLIRLEIEFNRWHGRDFDPQRLLSEFPEVDPEWLDELGKLPPPPPVPLPELPPRYLPVREIGRGGIGVVWRVWDITLKRTLAVKILRPKYRKSPGSNSRLDREALLTGALQHPGVPPVHDRGQLAGGSSFFALKLVEGKTLAARLQDRDTPLDGRGRLEIFKQIAQTIAYAHSRHVIHRDLKPANVMVGRFGEVQIMDWGMAKQLAAGTTTDPPTDSRSADAVPPQANAPVEIATDASYATDADPLRTLTRQGDVFGTPSYMAPEQARGDLDQLTARTDVFGLGAILFEMLTDNRLYEQTPTDQLLNAAARGDLASSLQILDRAPVDPELQALCRQCLDPDPDRRPADADVVAIAVADYLDSIEQRLRQTEMSRRAAVIKAREERKRRRLAWALSATIVATVVMAVAATLWYQRDQQIRRQRNEVARVETLINALATAPTEAIPYAIADLQRSPEVAIGQLGKVFANADNRQQQLHHALALDALGRPQDSFLIESLLWADGAQQALITAALRPLQPVAAAQLKGLFKDQSDRAVRGRLALVALDLDQPELAVEMAANEQDPVSRIRLIAAARDWHGDVDCLIQLADSDARPLVSYTALTAAATVPMDRIDEQVTNRHRNQLLHWCRTASHANLRSAAELLLNRWGIDPPQLPTTPDLASSSNRPWHVNSLGQVMIGVTWDRDRSTDGYDYFVADRETTISQFLTFLAEDRATAERLSTSKTYQRQGADYEEYMQREIRRLISQPEYRIKETSGLPMMGCGYDATLRFCNWMSQREGFEPVYRHDGTPAMRQTFGSRTYPDWRVNPGANGYRLLTMGEIEAISGNVYDWSRSKTFLSTGLDDHLEFAWLLKNSDQPQPVATRLPNRYGFFDLLGNVSEYCQFSRSVRMDFDTDKPIMATNYHRFGGNIRSAAIGNGYISQLLYDDVGIDQLAGFRIARCAPAGVNQWHRRYFRDAAALMGNRLRDSKTTPAEGRLAIRELNRLGMALMTLQDYAESRLAFRDAQGGCRQLLAAEPDANTVRVDLGGALVNESIAWRLDGRYPFAINRARQGQQVLSAAVARDPDDDVAARYLTNADRSLARAQIDRATELAAMDDLTSEQADQIVTLAAAARDQLGSTVAEAARKIMARLQANGLDEWADRLRESLAPAGEDESVD